MSDEPMIPRRLGRQTFYTSPWFSLHLDRVEFPGGHTVEKYQMLETTREVVGCVVTNDRGEFLLVRVPRYPTQRLEWEIPGGGIDAGETPVQAGLREALEESGHECADAREIYAFHPVNGYSNEVFHIVTARVRGGCVAGFDRREVTEWRWFSRGELDGMIRRGELQDGLTLAGLLLVFAGFGGAD